MNNLKDAKRKYDNIPIPAELNERVQKAINQSVSHRSSSGNIIKFYQKLPVKCAAGAAAALLLFTAALNTSTAFANEMQELPVIGTIARILTFRSYETEEDGLKISVEIPSLEIISASTNGLSDTVNQEILNLCQQYVDTAMIHAEEYKKAFLETGGTEEEWSAHNLAVYVFYEVKAQTEDYLSFIVEGNENWSSAYTQKKYYNINLHTEQFVSLADILGEDYIRLADESIREQIKQRSESEGTIFFSAEEGGFSGITEETNFYINEAGNPVIVFNKYEIAPGSEGEIEFEIKKYTDTEPESGAESAAIRYEDNFSVDSAAAAAFSDKIKAAVTEKDLQALSELAHYPLYVGLPEGGLTITSAGELLALGPDTLFTPELTASVTAAVSDDLSPSRAGFILSDGGTANIIFGITDGVLGINGINY